MAHRDTLYPYQVVKYENRDEMAFWFLAFILTLFSVPYIIDPRVLFSR